MSNVVYTFRRKLLDYGGPIPGSCVVVVVDVVVVVVTAMVVVVVGAAVVVVTAMVVVVGAAVVVVGAAVVVVTAVVEGCNVLKAGMIMLQYPQLGCKHWMHTEPVQL